jgi:hypothetical protein
MPPVIVIDADERTLPSRQRKRRKVDVQEYVDLVSDGEEYEPTPQPKRARKKAAKPEADCGVARYVHLTIMQHTVNMPSLWTWVCICLQLHRCNCVANAHASCCLTMHIAVA